MIKTTLENMAMVTEIKPYFCKHVLTVNDKEKCISSVKNGRKTLQDLLFKHCLLLADNEFYNMVFNLEKWLTAIQTLADELDRERQLIIQDLIYNR